MDFMNEIKSVLDTDFNKSLTENGAVGYRTSTHALLDMNFKVASYRSLSEEEMQNDFAKALNENFELAVTWLFFARDAREGLGERRLFRTLFPMIASGHPEVASKLLGLISEYGRWDDLFCLLGTPLEAEVAGIVAKQLTEDIDNFKAGKSISLLAKWMPSINTSSKQTRAEAKKLIGLLKMSEKTYRKLLAKLRSYLKVTEVMVSGNKWNEINYEQVPSKANLLYKNAFLRHDEERRREFLGKLTSGEVKINSGVLFPHDIVHNYTKNSNGWCSYRLNDVKIDPTLEGLWANLPKTELENTLVCADGSGSMTSSIGNTQISALDVADALAIYSSENNKGPYSNKFISFGAHPELVELKGKTLLDNLMTARAYDDCGNTNIEAVFDVVLDAAIKSKCAQEDMPKNILIISDMEFDGAITAGRDENSWRVVRPTTTLFETIGKKFEDAGYKMPKLIFWNVNSRTNTIPVKENDLGVALVSGFSQNVLKMVMSDKLNPWDVLVEMLMSERYKKIFDIVKEFE